MAIEDIDLDMPIDDSVKPAKLDFRDERMNSVVCPLCQASLRMIRADNHSFGEFGMWQCDECGTVLDLCNMVDKPAILELFIKEIGDGYYATLRSAMKQHGHFEKMKFEVSKTAVKNDRENAKLDKLEAQVKCTHCNERFNPAPSAKSMLTLEYCAKCRKTEEVRAEVARRETEAKAAARKAKAKAKKKPTRRKVG